MMKFTLGLFAILTVIGLGQAHQFPDFGKGQLHEDFQDILDLVPLEPIAGVVVNYVLNDNEVNDFLDELKNKTVIKDLLVDFQAIPEVTNLLDYLHKEGINVYHLINVINRVLKIKELVPPNSQVYSPKKRTGGLYGLFKDIKQHIDYDVFISIYVDKLKNSTVFVNFTNQLKSDNFQQIVNKVSEIKSVQFIVSRLEARSVNVKIVRDIIYLVLGINVPSPPSKTLIEELTDFVKLLPAEEFFNIIIKYINEDKKVQDAILYQFETEFHDLVRALEATKEHQALVVYLQKTGLPIIESIQEWHRAIGMEKYVPPKINFFQSLIKAHKIGDGMQGMLKDLYAVLPLDKIDALYEEKTKTSKVFVDFITKIKSEEMKEILYDLIFNKTFKTFITTTKEKGLDFVGAANLSNRIIGLKPPY